MIRLLNFITYYTVRKYRDFCLKIYLNSLPKKNNITYKNMSKPRNYP